MAKTPFRDEIISLDIKTGKVEEFGTLPTALASHASYLIDDKYLVIYGGTNGLRFFDNVIRYEIETKEWRLLTKYPDSQKSSTFFKDGRLSCVSATTPPNLDPDNQMWILFGGCTSEQDCSDFLVLHKSWLVDDGNYSIITEIM